MFRSFSYNIRNLSVASLVLSQNLSFSNRRQMPLLFWKFRFPDVLLSL
jgi:hypothetical protein